MAAQTPEIGSENWQRDGHENGEETDAYPSVAELAREWSQRGDAFAGSMPAADFTSRIYTP